MKLVRYGPAGKEKPGLIDADGKLRDLSKKVKDIDAAALAPSSLAALRKLDTKKLPLVKGRPRIGELSITAARASHRAPENVILAPSGYAAASKLVDGVPGS